jgi:hypothetical protein
VFSECKKSARLPIKGDGPAHVKGIDFWEIYCWVKAFGCPLSRVLVLVLEPLSSLIVRVRKLRLSPQQSRPKNKGQSQPNPPVPQPNTRLVPRGESGKWLVALLTNSVRVCCCESKQPHSQEHCWKANRWNFGNCASANCECAHANHGLCLDSSPIQCLVHGKFAFSTLWTHVAHCSTFVCLW